MRLCDVNILINAHRGESAEHAFYRRWLTRSLEARETFFYCEWILGAFVRIVTHPRIYRTPTPLPEALQFTDAIRSCPQGVGIMPGARHWSIFDQLCRKIGATGNLVPDAYLAALAIEANAEWVTADRDFVIFQPDLTLHLLRPE